MKYTLCILRTKADFLIILDEYCNTCLTRKVNPFGTCGISEQDFIYMGKTPNRPNNLVSCARLKCECQ
jgi:hypothetical protein